MGRIMQFWRDHPALLLLGGWLGVLLAGSIATISLVSLDDPEPEPEVSESVEVVAPLPPQPTRGEPPLWSVAVIAAGCGIGSLLISQRWRSPRTLRQLQSNKR
jgi:hypothetical protein